MRSSKKERVLEKIGEIFLDTLNSEKIEMPQTKGIGTGNRHSPKRFH